MHGNKALVINVLLLAWTAQTLNTIRENIDYQLYLRQYGYLPPTEGNSSNSLNIASNIRCFQKFANLPQTGVVDDETADMMKRPRCGNPDIYSTLQKSKRIKRYATHGTRWKIRHLTYRISRYPSGYRRHEIDDVIQQAFQAWSDVTPLSFTPTTCSRINIDILFASGYHGDGSPFDGPGKVLAHAYFPGNNDYPLDGDSHFDADESWTLSSTSNYGTSLLSVAIHEIGHSLGLLHSSHTESIMWPWNSGKIHLQRDDIMGIQKIYGPPGSNEGFFESAPPSLNCIQPGLRTISSKKFPVDPRVPSTTELPMSTTTVIYRKGLCSGLIDAFLAIPGGRLYIFIDNFVYNINRGLKETSISSLFPGSPSSVDAAFSVISLRGEIKVVLIKNELCWRYSINGPEVFTLDPNYPRQIFREFRLRLQNVKAAYNIDGHRTLCLISGDQFQYMKYDGYNVRTSRVAPLNRHPYFGSIRDISAVFRWTSGRLYAFSGRQYYTHDMTRLSGPRDTAYWWFGCSRF